MRSCFYMWIETLLLSKTHYWVFPKCFHWIRWIQWQKYLSFKGLEPTMSCVRYQDAITIPARQWKTGSFNWAQFMLQWFIRSHELAEFTEFNDSSAPFRNNSILCHRLPPNNSKTSIHNFNYPHVKVYLLYIFQTVSDCSCAQDAKPLTFGLCKMPECNHIGFLVIFFLLNIVTSSARVTTIPLQLRCKFTDLFGYFKWRQIFVFVPAHFSLFSESSTKISEQ